MEYFSTTLASISQYDVDLSCETHFNFKKLPQIHDMFSWASNSYSLKKAKKRRFSSLIFPVFFHFRSFRLRKEFNSMSLIIYYSPFLCILNHYCLLYRLLFKIKCHILSIVTQTHHLNYSIFTIKFLPSYSRLFI